VRRYGDTPRLGTQRTRAKGTVGATTLRVGDIEYLHLPQMGNPRDNRDSHPNADAHAVERFSRPAQAA
jgi:hypothetical protein